MRALAGIGCIALAVAAAATAGAAGPFTLSSPAFRNNAGIPARDADGAFGCGGQNLSPALQWSNPPPGTKSFALMVHDPDAPTGSGLWHWVVYDIPAAVTALAEGAGKAGGGALPPGALQGATDFGSRAYTGPCPPAGGGKHRYDFTLFALNVERLDVAPNATAAMVGLRVNAAALAKARLTGVYQRK